MKFHIIANAGSLLGHQAIRSYPWHLTLPQICHAHPDVVPTLAQMSREGVRIILDNGAYEGQVFNEDEFLRLVSQIDPAVIVLPDRPESVFDHSLKVSMTFYDRVRALCPNPNTKYMFCPQGCDKMDVLDGTVRFIRNTAARRETDRFILGLGLCARHWEVKTDAGSNAELGRLQMISALTSAAKSGINSMEIHILGARRQGSSAYNVYPTVSGVDTSKPMRCALAGVVFPEEAPSMPHASMDIVNLELLKANVKAWNEQWEVDTAGWSA